MRALKRIYRNFLIGFTLFGMAFGFMEGDWGLFTNPFFIIATPLWILFIAPTVIRIYKDVKSEEVEEVPEGVDYEKGNELAVMAGLWTYKDKGKFKAFTLP